jgi:hypothetical protein
MSGTLILHKGARHIERDELDAVECPPPTETWFPLRHSQVLSTVERTLGDAGFTITRSQYGLSPDDSRFFGTLDLSAPIIEGVSLTVGVRNSTDKTFPIGMVAGSRVFVCDNLAFNSEIYVSKKHTRFGKERFEEGISQALTALTQFQQVEALRISHYRDTVLDEDHAAAALLHAFELGIVSTRSLPEAIDEWRHPTLAEFEPRTAWSLFNAFTSALKQRQANPAEFASLTMKLYGLIDREAHYTISV